MFMDCWQCFNKVPEAEIYGDWYRCNRCLENLNIQPERSKREDSIPEWGANAPLNYDEWEKRCGALNSQETD